MSDGVICAWCGAAYDKSAEQCTQCLGPLLAPDALKLTENAGLSGFTHAQRIFYVLFTKTMAGYRDDTRWSDSIFSMLIVPAVVVHLGIAVGFLPSAVVYWALKVTAWVVGNWVLYLMFGVPLVVLVFARWLKASMTEPEFWLRRGYIKEGNWLTLGRLDEIFGGGAVSGVCFCFGITYGIQVALLYFVPGQMGLDSRGDFWNCWVTGLDNVLHGIMFGLLQLYDIDLGNPVQHTWLSSTVFYGMRLICDALFFLFVWLFIQKIRLRRMFARFPKDSQDVGDVLDWLDRSARASYAWRGGYFEEFLFLVIVKAYLRGNYSLVYSLSAELPWLKVGRRVRELFRDENDDVVFLGTYERLRLPDEVQRWARGK